MTRLSTAQREAWQRVVDSVRREQVDAQARLRRIVLSAGGTRQMLDAALDSVYRHARVVVHFHPDRIAGKAATVAECLLEEGQYRSQFETGLSAGSLTAYPGGPRDEWERMLFGGAYHRPDSTNGDRPKYGALELIRYPDGPWPRFGSCYMVLHQEVTRRTSFTFLGSEQVDAIERLGIIDCLDAVLAPLLAEVASGSGSRVSWPPFVAPTLGVESGTVPQLLASLSSGLASPRGGSSMRSAGRVLDSGIEAQVHGPIDLAEDVELLVADPAFRHTSTGTVLGKVSHRYRIGLDWHCGFRLAAAEVPEYFRGPAVSRLARRIAHDGMIDASVIGAVHAMLRSQPDEWVDCGGVEEVEANLKKLWHVLVHCGAPVSA